jgi:hypothetical protein
MSERVEFPSDRSRPESVQGIRQSRESRPEEAKKNFALELERKLSQDKNKDKAKKDGDEIIIHQDAEQEQDDTPKKNREGFEDKPPDETADPGISGANMIDILA